MGKIRLKTNETLDNPSCYRYDGRPWAAAGWVIPHLPHGSLAVIMGGLGAVVMPHNIFLHSEVIQSRQWGAQGNYVIKKQLKYEFLDTLTGMGVGWAINSAMIILSIQLPFTIVPLILLTSSREVMDEYANRRFGATVLWIVGLVVISPNMALLIDMARG